MDSGFVVNEIINVLFNFKLSAENHKKLPARREFIFRLISIL